MPENLHQLALDNGETLGQEIALLKRRLRLTESAVITMNVLTDTLERFQLILTHLAKSLDLSPIEGTSTGMQQYDEVRELLTTLKGNILVTDTKTRQIVPFAGWLHSQDQGMKGGELAKEFEQISQQHNNTRVILVRFFDTTDPDQLLKGLAKNDFLDHQIKLTK